MKLESDFNSNQLPETLVAHLYQFYRLVHDAHHADSSLWPIAHCNRILTSVMTCQSFAWQVIGITEAALAKLQETDFKRVTGCGVVRGHIVPRIETVRKLVSSRMPLPATEFIEFWINNDKTVFCMKSENKSQLPAFLHFDCKRPVLAALCRMKHRG